MVLDRDSDMERERESSRDMERRLTRERERSRDTDRRVTRERESSRDTDRRVTRERERLGEPDMVVTSASERNPELSGPIYRRLYVNNLPTNMTILKLRKMFRPYGIVELVELPLHKTGQCKCFAFVQFAQLCDAQKAKTSTKEVEGIKVSFVLDHLSEAMLGAQSKALSNEEADMTHVAAKCLSIARESDEDKPCVLDSLINKTNLVFTLLNQKGVVSNPTECLQLKNMFMFKTEELLKKFREDVKTLANKYGVLVHLYLDKNKGAVYMCFETVQEALAMQRVMHLRCYGENLVSANFVPPRIYEAMKKTFLARDARSDDAQTSVPATVVLRYMFTQTQMRADRNLCAEVEYNVKEESVKHGPLLSVKVCQFHPQGVVLIKFKDSKDAQKCIDANNGRWYAQRQIHASLDDGLVDHDEVRDFVLEAEW